MNYTVTDAKQLINLIADVSITYKDKLTQFDSNCGDGDLGQSMEKGALALKKDINGYTGEDIGAFLLKCAMSFNRAAPSTMGTLLSSAIMDLGKKFKGKTEIDEESVVKIPSIMVDAIMNRGKAQRGDKTILDALIPMSEAYEASFNKNRDLKIAVKAACIAAKNGAEGTKGMIARVGRAKWIAERSQEYQDGGAMLCYIVISKLAGE